MTSTITTPRPTIRDLIRMLPWTNLPGADDPVRELAYRWMAALPLSLRCPVEQGCPADIVSAVCRCWAYEHGLAVPVTSLAIIDGAIAAGIACQKVGAQTILSLRPAVMVDGLDRWSGLKMTKYDSLDRDLDDALNVTLVAISTSASVEHGDVVMAMDQAHDAAARAVYLQWQRRLAEERAVTPRDALSTWRNLGFAEDQPMS